MSYAAKSAHSPEGPGIVRLLYRPPVAQIKDVQPRDQTKVDEQEVSLHVELTPPDDDEPYTAEVFVKGVSQGTKDLAANSKEWRPKVKLQRGPNEIVIRLSNRWGAEATWGPFQLRYVQPPRIVNFDPPKNVDHAVLDLIADVESPADLPPREARLNDLLFRNDRGKDDQLQVDLVNGAKGLWKLTLHNVALNQGDNNLSLTVANEDDVCGKPATAMIHFSKPVAPPVVGFTDFKGGEQHFDVLRRAKAGVHGSLGHAADPRGAAGAERRRRPVPGGA